MQTNRINNNCSNRKIWVNLIENQLPKQCRLFLTKLLIVDVDRYLLPASWYLNTDVIEKRSGSVRVGSAPVCVALNQDFQLDKKEANEAFVAQQLQTAE